MSENPLFSSIMRKTWLSGGTDVVSPAAVVDPACAVVPACTARTAGDADADVAAVVSAVAPSSARQAVSMKASLLGRLQRRPEEKCTIFRSQATTDEPGV